MCQQAERLVWCSLATITHGRLFIYIATRKEAIYMDNDTTIKLRVPTQEEVAKWLNAWNNDAKNSHVVSSIQLLFEKIPLNNNLDEIHSKIAALDDLYSTHVRYLYEVANHILSIKDLDERLAAGDLTIVNEIASVPVVDEKGGKKIYKYYSFATKFCMFSNPKAYSIYDSYVEKVLRGFNEIDHFYDQKELDFRNYEDFDKILSLFREKYHAVFNNISRLDMDRYLWLLGKKTFPRNYSTKKAK